MMYSDLIKINKNFQTSINLELDLNNEKKVEEYIPTNDICDVLKRYMKTVNSVSGERATTLVGPYGKGKSFLLLILSYILSRNTESKTYRKLCQKISKIDPELNEMIVTFNMSGKKLLPVIVNSNYDNLNQAFMIALNESLKRENISNIIPKTTYSVCLDLIKEWNEDYDHITKVLAKCEKELKTSLRKIEMGLRNYDPEAYKQFVTLYNCVTHGMPFNPLVSNDIIHVFSEVNHELPKFGYCGMFVIFDEFSKFLESAGTTLSKDLKRIQDFAELAVRSSRDEQFHICCVTHKSLALYKSSESIDSFKTVEGRFKEIKFNRSLDENYQIISAAIDNSAAKEASKEYINRNKEFYTLVSSLEPFRREIDLNGLYYGCFPLNPLTVYSLIQLSELVAQNERTLFTFISDTDDNSFNSFIHRNAGGLFNVDKIYDYFSPLMKREEGNGIRNIWYRAEGLLSRIDDQNARSIIKSLAVILMINDIDNLPPDEKTLIAATHLTKDTVSMKVNNLIEKHLLRKNLLNGLLSFATANNKDIEDRISIISQTKINSVAYESILDEINELRYLLPRRYNEQNKITRFYRVLYITEEQLKKLSSFEIFRERGFSDGLVLNLIRTKMNDIQIQEEFMKFCDSRVIIRYPIHPVQEVLFDELNRRIALQELLYKGGNDQVITNEIKLYLQEVDEDIKKLVSSSFEENSKYVSYLIDDGRPFTDVLSDQMDLIYTKKIVFNNELINKNNITSVYQKAANNVIEDLINKREREYSLTSPETTIKNSVVSKMVQPDVQEVIREVKKMILDAENHKLSIREIVDKYTEPPFGIRKGVLSVIIAECINESSDNILLYLKDQEIDLSARNLVKAVNTDAEYFFRSSKGTMAQANYMVDLLYAFGKMPSGNFRIDTKVLCEEYRKFFVGLPMILRNAKADNVIGISENIIEYKKVFMSFNLNPFEVVFEIPLKLYKSRNYNIFKMEVMEFIKKWERYLDRYKMMIVSSLKSHFNIQQDTSLRMGLNAMIKDIVTENKPILNETNSRISMTIETMSFDDIEAINQIANATMGTFIEDWIEDRSGVLINSLDGFFEQLSESKKIDVSTASIDRLLSDISYSEPSAMGSLFQNSIESVLDEFGESISTEEKIAVLTSILKKYL